MRNYVSVITINLLAMILIVATAEAQFVRQEIHSYQSSNTSLPEFLTGHQGKPVIIGGHLRLATTNAKQPAVVLLHGAGGIGGSDSSVGEWARDLNEAGYEVLEGALPEQVAYRRASDEGRAATETRFTSLNKRPEILAQSIVNKIATLTRKSKAR